MVLHEVLHEVSQGGAWYLMRHHEIFHGVIDWTIGVGSCQDIPILVLRGPVGYSYI